MAALKSNRASVGPVSRLEGILTATAMLATGALCAIVIVVVASRWLYRPLIPDYVQLVSILMIVSVLLPLASVTRRDLHIRVTVFTERKSATVKRRLAVLGDAAGLAFMGLLLWAGVIALAGEVGAGEYFDGDIDIPNWIGHALYVTGLGACAWRLALRVRRIHPGRGKREG